MLHRCGASPGWMGKDELGERISPLSFHSFWEGNASTLHNRTHFQFQVPSGKINRLRNTTYYLPCHKVLVQEKILDKLLLHYQQTEGCCLARAERHPDGVPTSLHRWADVSTCSKCDPKKELNLLIPGMYKCTSPTVLEQALFFSQQVYFRNWGV